MIQTNFKIFFTLFTNNQVVSSGSGESERIRENQRDCRKSD
jgi:hypothetical protein